MKSKENTFNEVLALMSQNEMGIAYKVLNRYGDNPNKLLDMTKKILEHNYIPNLGDEDSALIKKYMMISIMAGSQVLQVLSFFDFQSKNFPRTIQAKVLSEIDIGIPVSNLLLTENSVKQALELVISNNVCSFINGSR